MNILYANDHPEFNPMGIGDTFSLPQSGNNQRWDRIRAFLGH